MKLYEFTVKVRGWGDTPEEAWDDLMDEGILQLDDLSIPDPSEIEVIDEEE